MLNVRHAVELHVLSARHACAVLTGLALALLPGVAAAQEAATDSDRDRVMLWTAIASIGALVLAAIGYAYRRMRGMDHPTPDEIEMMGSHHDSHDASHVPHGAPGAPVGVPPHAEAEHGPATPAPGPSAASHH